jgi:ribosomal protein S18 acetylase RimI-like enzyme
MDIRILGPGDEDLLAAAVDLADEGPLDLDRAAVFLAEPDLVNVVALDGREPVGFVYGYVLRRFEASSFFIYSVDVTETHQRRGLAKAMLTRLAEEGRATGRWDEMFVFTNAGNAPAMALYASAGGVRPNPDDVMWDFYL